MEELIEKLKVELIEALNLEEITPEDIDSEAPLFGDDGLGLDSIDALEIILILERNYGIKIENPAKGKGNILFGAYLGRLHHRPSEMRKIYVTGLGVISGIGTRSKRKSGLLKIRKTRYGENHPFPHRT